MTANLTRFAFGLLPAALLVGSSATASPSVPLPQSSSVPAVTTAAIDTSLTYMPLEAGRRLTYETTEGERFSLTFDAPRTVRWFDGSEHEVVPVADTRCSCQVLYRNDGGEIRAVGEIEKGKLYTWGEYFVVWPAYADASGETEIVATPAGRFNGAVRVVMPEGSAWFAPGIGIVKADGYALANVESLERP